MTAGRAPVPGPLAEKICLLTNCGLLQGGPDAAEFQRQGATLFLQTTDLAQARPVLTRDGVDLTPKEDEPPVTLTEDDFCRSGVADSHVSEIAPKAGRLDILANNNAPERIDQPFHEIEDAEWDEMYRQVVTEMFRTTKAAVSPLSSVPSVATCDRIS